MLAYHQDVANVLGLVSSFVGKTKYPHLEHCTGGESGISFDKRVLP